jgi:NADPH:quinone reductase
MMRAVRFHRFGGPEVLQVERVPNPSVPSGHALIEVVAAGVNFADTERRRGLYLADEPLPATTGFEGAGIVSAVGSKFDKAWLGKRVAFVSAAAMADLCVVHISRLIHLPESLSMVEGAAFPVQGLTAWHVLHTMASVRAGETVCVTAAAGGVGQFAIQLARAAGATVIGIVSSEAKRRIALSIGAHEAMVGFTSDDFGSRVDVLLDSVGHDAFDFGWRVLKPYGRWVCFGDSSGAAPAFPASRLLERSLTVSGWWLRTPMAPDVWASGVSAVIEALVRKKVVLDVHASPMSGVAEVHRSLESRASTGKHIVQLG